MSLTPVTVDFKQTPLSRSVQIARPNVDATVDFRAEASSVSIDFDTLLRPNIFLVLLDDIGIEMFETYDTINQAYGLNTNGGNPWSYPDVRTIDALAGRTAAQRSALTAAGRSSVIYDEAHAYPVCSPTRYGIQTGRYGFRQGVGTIIDPANDSANYSEAGSLSGTAEVSIAQALSLAGYKSAMVGKSHLGQYISEGGSGGAYVASQLGYNVFRGTIRNLNTDPDISASNGHEQGYWNYQWYDSNDNSFVQVDNQYVQIRMRNNVKGTINNLLKAQPWLMMVTCHAAHTPHGGADNGTFSGSFPGESDAEVDGLTWSGSGTYPYASREDTWVSFRAAIEALDFQLDNIINGTNGLVANGLYDNTVFIVVGDNGTAASALQAAQTAGEDIQDPIDDVITSGHMKGSVFRQGTRVPLIVSGPDRILKGTVGRHSSIRVDTVDLWPTILELCGVRVSDAVGQRTIDGISFAPTIWHEDADLYHPRDINYTELFGPNGDPFTLTPGGSNRWDRKISARVNGTQIVLPTAGGTDYSLIRLLDGSEFFFNQTTDPLERSALANSGDAYNALVARLNALLAS